MGDDITGGDSLIIGAPTWHTDADEQRSGTAWDDWLYDTLPNLDVSGKKIAIFGVGDQESYSDYYCDGLESCTTNSQRPVPPCTEPLPRKATTTLDPRPSKMENLL